MESNTYNSPVTEEELVARSQFPRVTMEQLEANIVGKVFYYDDLTISCRITLKNGFSVMGESGCAVPGNYKRDVGERLAYQDAQRKIWPLMGYELKSKVALVQDMVANTKPIDESFSAYVGTKALYAKPMNRGDYNLFKNWKLPADENPNDQGYIVQYPDGHISWSPVDTFDAAYEAIDISGEGAHGGPTWYDRLCIEIEQLEPRVEKLKEFLDGVLFKSLPEEQQNLLLGQWEAMCSYLAILKTRAAKD